MSSEGFFIMHRGWRDNPIFKSEFSRADAWVWLIENACWKPTKARIKGDNVELQRGELTFSVRFLADKWGWSKSRVDRFLDDLRSESMIETRSKIGTGDAQKAGHGQSIITICNYTKYQDVGSEQRDNSGTTIGTTAGQQRDKEEQRNKGTIEEEPNGSSPPVSPKPKSPKADAFVCPAWADADVWADLLRNRKSKRTPNTPTAYKRFLKDLMAMVDDEWPPGRLLEAIVARGWAAAYDPRGKHYGNASATDRRNPSGHNGPDNRDGFTRALDRDLGLYDR